DRQGKSVGRIGPGGNPQGSGVQLSPDGKRILVTRADRDARTRGLTTTQGTRTWIADTNRGIFSRVNADEGTESGPAFMPDGRVIFSSTLNRAFGDLYRIEANGLGRPEPLLVKSAT